MNWLSWIGAVFGGLVVIDFLFVGVIVTIDVIKNWGDHREKRRTGTGDHRAG